MNKDVKTIIPGRGRAGTTLLMRLLMLHPRVKPWLPENPTDRFDVQPDCKSTIREKWPYMSSSHLFKPGDWNLVKCPEFSLEINTLNEVYPGCRFIVTDRALEERVRSSINVNATGWITKTIEANDGLRDIVNTMIAFASGDIRSCSVERQVRAWWLLHDSALEFQLFRIPESRILRISFHDMMRDLKGELSKIFSFMHLPQFCDGKAWLDEMVKASGKRYQIGAHPPGYWKSRGER